MSKIINIHDHIELEKQKRLEKTHRHQIDALQKIILFFSCLQRCSRCGVEVGSSTSCPFCSPDSSFGLCPACAEEYEEYKRAIKGLETENIPWHNQEWKEMWQAWLEYQTAFRKYQQSPEIKELLKKE